MYIFVCKYDNCKISSSIVKSEQHCPATCLWFPIASFNFQEGNSDHSANVTVEVLDNDEEDVDVPYSEVVKNLRAGHFYTFWVRTSVSYPSQFRIHPVI